MEKRDMAERGKPMAVGDGRCTCVLFLYSGTPASSQHLRNPVVFLGIVFTVCFRERVRVKTDDR